MVTRKREAWIEQRGDTQTDPTGGSTGRGHESLIFDCLVSAAFYCKASVRTTFVYVSRLLVY